MISGRLLGFTLVAFLALTVCGYAQCAAEDLDPNADNLLDLNLDDLMDITVYAASKRTQTTFEAPAGVTIVTQDDIKRYGYRTLSDILNSVPGFYISNNRVFDFSGLRGVSYPNNGNMRILFTLNDLRLNDGIFDVGNIDRAFPVSIESIEKVEIIRGPASLLYGTNAFFGIVNVVTKKPSKPNDAQISVSSGSFGSSNRYANYGYLFENGAFIELSGSLYEDHGRKLYFEEYDDPLYSTGKTSGDADRENSGNVLLSLHYEDFSIQASHSERTKHVPYGIYETLLGDPGTKDRAILNFVELKVGHDFSDTFKAMAKIAYFADYFDSWWVYDDSEPEVDTEEDAESDGEENVETDAEEETDAEPETVSGKSIVQRTVANRDVAIGRWWLGEANVTTEVLNRNKITVGAEYKLNIRQFMTNFDENQDVPYFENDGNLRGWALYVDDEIYLHKKVTLDVGIRYDHYSFTDSVTSPRLVLIYNVLPRTNVKLVYGTAFRAPNKYEMQYYLPGADGSATNLRLKPERISSYELILEQQLRNNMWGSASIFSNKMSNIIYDQVGETDFATNVGLETVYGTDLTIGGRLPDDDVRWKSSYSFSEATDDKTGLHQINSPRHILRNNISSPLFSPKTTGSIEALFESKRQTLLGNNVGRFATFNVVLLSTHIPKLNMTLGLYNVFNRRYRDPYGEPGGLDSIIQDGRTALIKLAYDF